jgi:radical SAM superfamily enzyme YgiQ (UPF0313 family)
LINRRLLLVNPVQILAGRRQRGWNGNRFVPPLNLAYIAALTPPDWEIRIVDENAGDDATRLNGFRPDLVGITAFTATIPRAYELAAAFRRQGLPVIIGGSHASALPEEVACFADSAFVGQAEGAWRQVLDDLESGHLQPVYRGGMPPLAGLPVPRRDLYPHRYRFDAVLTSKGCPHACEFCSVWKSYERRTLQRPPGEVLDELAALRARHLFFVDDNLTASRAHAIELCRGMVDRRLGKRFAIQASLDAALDDELLYWLQKAGCFLVSVGLESTDEVTLQQVRKASNLRVGVACFATAVARFHARGMAVSASIIFGHDRDTPETFRHTEHFGRTSGLDSIVYTILTPLPGTDLHTRLQAEGRLFELSLPHDYAYYDAHHVLFAPQGMQAVELHAANRQAVARWTAGGALAVRAWRTWRQTRSALAALAALQNNRWARINAQENELATHWTAAQQREQSTPNVHIAGRDLSTTAGPGHSAP